MQPVGVLSKNFKSVLHKGLPDDLVPGARSLTEVYVDPYDLSSGERRR